MNIALTGSSGLIGSLLIKDLEAIGHKVLCISSSCSSHESNKYLYDEILSGKHILEVDCLMHLASLNSELKELDIDKEVALSVQAIKCMDILKCNNIIFFSSIKVYGDNSFYYQQFNEDSPLNPVCFYGIAKKKFDIIGTPHKFLSSCGNLEEARDTFGLSARKIFSRLK